MAPLPKPAGTVRRRNRVPEPTALPAAGRRGKTPPLPARNTLIGGESPPAVLAATRKWWATVWASPMAVLYQDADVPGLVRLALLVDTVHRGFGIKELATEIRHLEDRFGLSPSARIRLRCEIKDPPAAEPAQAEPVGERARARLHAVP